MTTRPAWMDALNLFDYCFNTLGDLFFVVFGLMIVLVVSRPGLRQHLPWANTSAIACILTGCARFIRDMHFFFGFGERYTVSVGSTLLYYLATLFAAYSTYKLWQTLRNLSLYPASPDPLAEHPAQTGFWPPAPTLKR
jgi:hypothetical protein